MRLVLHLHQIGATMVSRRKTPNLMSPKIEATMLNASADLDAKITSRPINAPSKQQGGNKESQSTRHLQQPVVSEANKPTRMSVSLPPDAAEMLDVLATSQGISKNEALRKAIATEAYFQKEISEGSTILVQKTNNELREIVFR